MWYRLQPVSSRWQSCLIYIRISAMTSRFALYLGLLVSLLSFQPRCGFAQDSAIEDLKKAVDSPSRAAEEKARDEYRHPFRTLTFFGLKPDMTVVEIWPGGGWYTDILAPYLHDHGKLYAAVAKGENVAEYKKKLADNPAEFGNLIVTQLDPPDKMDIAPAGSADMVVTFRNVHNWMRGGNGEAVFKAMYAALKPGGILGVEEHRGDPKVPQDPKAESGYVRQDYVIKLGEDAGFHLVAKSEVNANPKDTKDYAKGVWTLPPTLRLGDTDKAKYLAIGESDRMTLKFVKPIKTASR
jgi:predicted methyltransferase